MTMTEHLKERNNRIYLDDDDVYMREYASYDNIGFYLSFNELKQLERDNYENNKYYISTIHYSKHTAKVRSLAGVKTYKYKFIDMRQCKFYCGEILEGREYNVFNTNIRQLYDTMTGKSLNTGLLFLNCLNNYDIVEYMIYGKDTFKHDLHFHIYEMMQNKYMYKYKRDVANKLSKYFYKDLSNIINDYLIMIVK